MSDTISLLPESLANQIAAGEVVQRPASVVKELLENAIDAGASLVKLIVKDAGKSLVQVIDNGKGMSETDARLCFERHATSKIKSTEDLFSIKTKGFRGEALAAISAVAQVELKTKLHQANLGTHIEIENNTVTNQEACQCSPGSSFVVKNLFFNVPARRNFLKEDSTELKHIIDEFERVALAHPDIAFTLHSNNNELYNLPAGTLIQRITSLFSSGLKEKLVAVNEETSVIKISGYVGKPEHAKKRRGDQFFFANQRFIRSPYLHHAIMDAYSGLILNDEYPTYYLFIELPPQTIDINIHPTKTEIKFEDEKTVYAILKTTVKRALGKNNLAPSIDFEVESSFNIDLSKKEPIEAPSITFNTTYNPFKSYAGALEKKQQANWQNLYDDYKLSGHGKDSYEIEEIPVQSELFEHDQKINIPSLNVIQLHHKYIVFASAKGMMLVDQSRAHERVLYEHYKLSLQSHAIPSQQELFPQTCDLSTNDFLLIQEIKMEMKHLGFEIENFGKSSIIIHGIPADLSGANSLSILEGILENYKLNNIEVKLDKRENICRSMARNTCILPGKVLSSEEMNLLLHQLFDCENHMYTASGKAIMIEMGLDEIERSFKFVR